MDDLGCHASTLSVLIPSSIFCCCHASTIDLASHIIRVALTLKIFNKLHFDV
ncbi:hypothetical protein R6Q59_029628 [Mikania micrantha]